MLRLSEHACSLLGVSCAIRGRLPHLIVDFFEALLELVKAVFNAVQPLISTLRTYGVRKLGVGFVEALTHNSAALVRCFGDVAAKRQALNESLEAFQSI